jgi:hypothetical protein
VAKLKDKLIYVMKRYREYFRCCIAKRRNVCVLYNDKKIYNDEMVAERGFEGDSAMA